MWNIFSFCCGSKEKQKPPNRITQVRSTPPQQSNTIQPPPSLPKKENKPPQSNQLISGKQEISSTSIPPPRKDRYEGEQLDGVPHGNGSMLYANGDFYRGQWVMGKKQGRGLQIYQDGGTQYEGQWQDDQQHGHGKLSQPSGSYYQGQFKGGKKDGKGQYYDFTEKKMYSEEYENGVQKQHKEIMTQRSREEDFPTLALDKQRFNTDDLTNFEMKNPQIKQFQLPFLLKYFSLIKVIKLEFIFKNIKEWTVKEVIDFLDHAGLRQYKEIFYKNKVKGKDLISLNQKELKEDLGMKMGDRKRFMNYIVFLNEDQQSPHKKKKQKRDPRRKNSLKFGSSKSMKRVLDNLQSRPIYEESIQQQMSYSSESDHDSKSKSFKKINRQQRKQKSSEQNSDNERDRYGSVVEAFSPRKSTNGDRFSLKSEESERSSSKKKDPIHNHRKDSKQNGSELNGKEIYAIIPKKQSMSKLEHPDKERPNEQQNGENGEKNQNASKSSSSSSSSDVLEMTRKKTSDSRIHQHSTSQIRELYEFLKQHRSLQFLIKEKDIEKLEMIGEGGYGKVYKGKYIGQLIAIKDYMKTKRHKHKEDFMKELMIISDLKHPNIVLYMGICITADKFILVTEYLENGSLFDQLHKKHKKFDEMEKIEIGYEVVKGMVYLHNMKNILHRDLKSSNVLIGQDWNVVKLCDFGLASQKKKQKKHKRVGTYQWMAPEVIRNEDKIDEKADVYSFGVIIWQLVTERVPYAGLSQNQIVGLVGYDQNHHLDDPEEGSEFLIHIMNKCLNRDQEKRPSFIELQNDFENHFTQQETMPAKLQTPELRFKVK